MNSILSKEEAPCRVKIIKCSYPQGWYANLIGEEFDTDLASPPKDYVLWEDYSDNATMWRHIAQEDCIRINQNKKQSIMPTNEGFAQPDNSANADVQDAAKEKTQPLTFGQKLVGLTFNPSGDEKVNKAKQLCADLADLIHDSQNQQEDTQLSMLLFPSTISKILDAQMSVVKLLTLKY